MCGPTPSPYLFLGAGPGRKETITGIPYTGLAGDELNDTYLAAAHLRRDEVAIDNCQSCWWGEDKVQEKRAIECARTHLPETFRRVQPEVVVLMGGVTCRLADERIRLDIQHGIPVYGSILGGLWTGWIWPMFEPALGMRDTSRMTPLLDDFRHLGQWLRREWDPPTPADLTVTDYGLCKTKADVADYFDEYGTGMKAGWTGPAVDTESHGSKVWSVQWSTAPHSGRMILADDRYRSALQELKLWLASRTISLHKADADIDPLERLGLIDRRTLKWRDTLQEAYHLCSLPQGLKALAYRLFGARMTSWEETVWPASVAVMLKWLADGQAAAQTDLQETIVTQLVRPRCLDCGHQHSKGPCKHDGCTSTRHSTRKVEYKPSAIEQVFKHVERYTRDTADDDRPYDPWRAIAKMKVTGLRGRVPEEFEWAYLEQTLGPMPILGIGNCDLESAVTYGCEDASITGMVAARLVELRKDKEWLVEPEDFDR